MPEESDSSFRIAAKLILDEPRSIYYSGQVLSGHIECELTEPLSYTAVNITIIGEGNVFWTETECQEYNGVRDYVEVGYRAKETYINTMLCASGGMGVITLPPGSHQVPFQFQIPHTAPSSFRGSRGKVFYKLIAYIEYPDPTKNRDQLEKQFEVVAPFDLNTAEDVKRPIDLEFEETYSCCCVSNPMNITIHMPASGFCPGQIIPLTVVADNQSDVEINKIVFQLIKKECYHSAEPKSDYIPPEEVLETIKTGPRLGRTKAEHTYELRVPDFIVPNLQNCTIIDVGYFIKVTIKLSGCNDDLEDETEICLGLKPLASLVENFTHPMQSDLPQAPIPDPNFIWAAPVLNKQEIIRPIENSAAYPTAAPFPTTESLPIVTPYPPNEVPYPTSTSPYPPNAMPYPPDSKKNPLPGFADIAMTTLRTGNIGFVAPTTPNEGRSSAPYPGANSSPYPGANPPYPVNPPYPGANSSPYPTTHQAGQQSFAPSAPSAPPATPS